MLEVEEEKKEGVYGLDSFVIGVVRVGGKMEKFVVGIFKEFCDVDELFGGLFYSLVLFGRRIYELEYDYVREFVVNKENWDRIWKVDYEGKYWECFKRRK